MNAMKILQSVEELLYEVMSWLLFYPRTLAMTLSHPLRTMRYSDAEQRDKPEKQYLETLSPPLFLVLSILLAHGLELVFGYADPQSGSGLGRVVMASDQNLLIFRALMFSLHPLVFAWGYLSLAKRKIDRDTLRTPFFAQCYLAGTTSILIGLAGLGLRDPQMWTTLLALSVTVLVTIWYVSVQRLWLMSIVGMTKTKAWLSALAMFAAATGVVVVGNLLVV